MDLLNGELTLFANPHGAQEGEATPSTTGQLIEIRQILLTGRGAASLSVSQSSHLSFV
jgi:hypothetical protein